MEDDVVLYQGVLKFPFALEKVSLDGVMSTVTSSVVVRFGDIQVFPVYAELRAYQFRDIFEESLNIDVYAHALYLEPFVDLSVIASVDEHSYGEDVCLCHGVMNLSDLSL